MGESFSSVDVLMRSPSLPYRASSQAARTSGRKGPRLVAQAAVNGPITDEGVFIGGHLRRIYARRRTALDVVGMKGGGLAVGRYGLPVLCKWKASNRPARNASPYVKSIHCSGSNGVAAAYVHSCASSWMVCIASIETAPRGGEVPQGFIACTCQIRRCDLLIAFTFSIRTATGDCTHAPQRFPAGLRPPDSN